MIYSKHPWRCYVVIFLLLTALSGLIWRLLDLNLMNRHFLLAQSDARILRVVDMPSHRGMITDRLGSVLAISSPVYSAWINPKFFQPTFSQLHALSELLHMPVSSIEARAEASKKAFVYLKRQNTPEVMAEVKALQIPGLHFQMDYQRFYPEGEAISHVLGITNVDDHGQEGLELAYNDWLSGSVGKKEVLKDRLGHIISEIAVLKKPQEGRDLTLSIDHRIQYIAYRALKEQVENMHAAAGSIVVLNVKTGEILAMANLPSYNPNNRDHEPARDLRNSSVTDSFEPGSVMKPFTIALGLESGKYTKNSTIDTHPGYMNVGGFEIRDDFRDNGVIDLKTILEISSNIGAAKILLSLPPTALWRLLRNVGFGDSTQSGFPGEVGGRLTDHPVWYKSEVATLAYGYGVSVTTLQLARAYAILAGNGIRYPVTFLKLDAQPEGERVISEKTSKEVAQMLESVITGDRATGRRAKVVGYSVAGKTGTAYIATSQGYDKKRYNSDFAGFAPVSNPQLVIAVVIRDPKDEKGRHFGGEVAAPVFSKVMGDALRILNVPPDNLK